jgi:hypothetical protein
VKVLTRHAPAPQLSTRRKRGKGETGRAFTMAARKIMRRAARIPAAAYVVATILPGNLDWLNPWQGHDMTHTNDPGHLHEPPPTQHIYPHV